MKRIFLSLVCILCFCQEIIAETTGQDNFDKTGILRGVIFDPVEARIIKAKITVKNKTYSQQVMSNENGEYQIAVPAGTYEMVVEATGFKKYRRKKIQIDEGRVYIFEIKLKIGLIV